MSAQDDPRPGLRQAATCANCAKGQPAVFNHPWAIFCGAHSECDSPLFQHANQVCDLHTPCDPEEVQP